MERPAMTYTSTQADRSPTIFPSVKPSEFGHTLADAKRLMKRARKAFVYTSLGYTEVPKKSIEFYLFNHRKNEAEPMTSELDYELRFWLEGRAR
jgi:hypothetical protein